MHARVDHANLDLVNSADLPIAQPRTFEMVINLKTAKARAASSGNVGLLVCQEGTRTARGYAEAVRLACAPVVLEAALEALAYTSPTWALYVWDRGI